MIKAWMVWRYLQDGRKYLGLSFVLSVSGIALGVASLVIAMAVVSGYETTLRESVINMQGHVRFSRVGSVLTDQGEVENKIRDILPELLAMTPYVIAEGLIAHNKKLSGIALEGVDPGTVGFVLSLDKLISAGSAQLTSKDEIPSALIGKGVAKKFNIQVGEEFKLVIPVTRSRTSDGFKPKMQRFRVTGVLDLGRADFDERYVVTDIRTVQKFAELEDRISGWRLKLSDYRLAVVAKAKIEDKLGYAYSARAWPDANRNLFQAVKYEKVVIFIIILLMIVAAAFNVASTLFLSVVRRYPQISILKAMGGSQRFVRQLFTYQGLIIGLIGATFGLVLGKLGCKVFLWAEKKWGFFPGEVYKLDHVDLEIRLLDVALILSVTLLICYISTLAPARRGARLSPVEGLHYE